MVRLSIIFLLIMCGCYAAKKATTKSEWVQLFNGKDLNNWVVKIHHHDVGINFGNTFRVNNNAVEVRYDQYKDFNNQFGHLFYKTPFAYYHLKLQYRFVGGWVTTAPDYTLLNSGIMFHSQSPYTMPKEQDWPISVEMQFLGGLGDGKPRPTGNMCSPGTEVMQKGSIVPSHCINSTSKTYEGEQWINAELIVLGDSLITHIINGDTVLQYSQPQIGGGVANGFDNTIKIDGKLLSEGYIALQSEGQPIDFRNIYIKDLSNTRFEK
jgi:hypothetical protein